MGKRSDFERKPRDFYPTPFEAVVPLFPHLTLGSHFSEPCAGDGALIRHLEQHLLFCVESSDIDPQANGIDRRDALLLTDTIGEMFITNPPWDRPILHDLMVHLSDIAPTWLLIDADWMHTRQSAPFMWRVAKIVSVGRVKWIPGSKHTGKDNCCWVLLDGKRDRNEPAAFHGRV